MRLVGDNVTVGIYSIEEALSIAARQELDLVEITDRGELSVCKVVDYAKFKYEQKKKQKAIQAKVQKIVLKEVRLSPNTDEHDFNFKLKHAMKFLEDHAKVKVVLQFKGRAIAFKERGELLLLKFAQALENHGKVEQLPRMEGRRMMVTLTPKQLNK